MKNENVSYTLTPSGSSKISAALCKVCASGADGESLIRHGLNQGTFNAFVARLAARHLAAGKTPEQLADVFALVSATNASAANKALAEATITFEGGKPQSVSAFWGKSESKAPVDLKLLDL